MKASAAVAALFVALALVWGLQSTAFQEADEVTHYSLSRWLFHYPQLAVDIWGRPVVSLFYALPAQLGPTAARLSSIVLGLVVAWSAARLFSRAGGREPAFAVACTLGMPFVFFQMYGILTELAFSAVLGAGFVAFRAGRPRAAALVWSLTPLARPEGFFVAPLLAAVFLFGRRAHASPPLDVRRFACASLLLAGTAAWWLGGLPVFRTADWMIEEWPRNWRVTSVYGDGHPLLFPGFVAVMATPLLFPFLAVGVVRWWRGGVRLEIATIAFVVLLHGVLWTFGLFGSAGYPRYLVTVAPLIGAATGAGIETLVAAWDGWRRPRRPHVVHTAVVAVLAAVLLSRIIAWPRSGPVRGDADSQMLRAIWPWCREQIVKKPDVRFVTDHPFFFIPGDLDRARYGYPFRRHVVEYADEGTIAVWETKFAGRYSTMKDRAELRELGFEPVPSEEVAGPRPYRWEGVPPPSGDPELENFEFEVFRKTR
jgi:hypothetical protein